jgi:hypothetical protein
MIRSIRELVRFVLDAERPGDVAFKVTALLILSPLLVLLVVADVVDRALRRERPR